MANYTDRFGGIARLYGQESLKRFSKASVCVIGIGGVGSWSAEALARSGLGNIHLIDLDDICVTNTNRQVHTLVNTIGEAKVDAMKIRLLQINPDCRVTINEDFVSQENAKEYISTEFNYVIEATDNVSAKAAIIAHCKRSKIPMITIGGAGGQLDPTQIKVADLSRTIQDPLAAKLRSYLRRHYNFSDNPKRRFGVQCVYSTEQLRYPQSDGTVSFSKNSQATGTKLDCQTGFGASVNVTASFGLIAAANVLNKLAF